MRSREQRAWDWGWLAGYSQILSILFLSQALNTPFQGLPLPKWAVWALTGVAGVATVWIQLRKRPA